MTPRLTAAEWLQAVKRDRIIAVVRADDLALSLEMAEAAIAAGLKQVEITSTSADFVRAIASLRERYPEQIIGTGTVVDAAVGREAIAAGAQFIFSPYCTAEVLDLALQADVAMVPGALTPTEIGNAWRAGATAIKVFPIRAVGGAEYLQALRGPMGEIPLIPTGGISRANAASFLQSGAIAVGLATDLFPTSLIRAEQWTELSDRIRRWVETIV
ncbi:bifunctional 4-hydroxy-2-oxoglutarate aldolase/2-dehydro-3-deoxy-phosphogluconate aldolase [Synechococcus sp. PCC 7336]|uniref:bifunctional 4-hydroxy-2-oxoglutarate aldolase/2-dehydro-3-deoxy-phosphogluconate aldolase n=1 Tax=Synechococcus sp. PCC 7336 TaxID=195250 RepID=UPI001D0D28B2|nr:bifunctional 4-hydroxy-2-oxoglutarate aldolase/2-dehydro-3-deoxy-phosphogluconate aldolase [Synechococcus sp. PCC 7336]